MMHNSIRNGLWILPKKTAWLLINLTSSETMVERERPEVVPGLPRLSPFDVSVMFDNMLDQDPWRSDLKILGIDISIVSPASEPSSSPPISQTTRFQGLFLHLKEGVKKSVVMAKLTKKVAFLTVVMKSWASLKETTWR